MKRNKLFSMIMCISMVSMLFGCGASDDTYDSALIGNDAGHADINNADMVAEVADADGMKDAIGDAISYDDNVIGSSNIQPDTGVGLLTAGVWNDNDNWGFFTNLVKTGTITFPSYCTPTTNRLKVKLKNNSNQVIKNAKIELISTDDNVIWTSITDKNGIAYLFFNDNTSADTITITNNGNSQNFDITLEEHQSDTQDSINTISQEIQLTIDDSSTDYKKMEIMFIVDTTGSMGDEMLFLQSEFTGIAKEIGTQNTTYSVNFYRDTGDEYVTKCFDFTNDIDELQTILNSQSADGGGDEPEAVAQILDEAIVQKQWGDDTVKLAFLIFDAPPHDDTKDTLENAIKTASEKGIRLIPVISSNTNRDTEIFARTLSIATNGTYVFLTDDSGIGGEHLEPIIGEYTVEKLFDIIIRIINDYRQ